MNYKLKMKIKVIYSYFVCIRAWHIYQISKKFCISRLQWRFILDKSVASDFYRTGNYHGLARLYCFYVVQRSNFACHEGVEILGENYTTPETNELDPGGTGKNGLL